MATIAIDVDGEGHGVIVRPTARPGCRAIRVEAYRRKCDWEVAVEREINDGPFSGDGFQAFCSQKATASASFRFDFVTREPTHGPIIKF